MRESKHEGTLKVAVVGAGPSGFYASEALLRAGCKVTVDLFERLPTPFGLVRYGVAPDHPQLKNVTRIFERIAESDGFRFIGNIHVGRDISVDDLSECYHAIIFATGVEQERNLGIPGEHLPGSYSARSFVAWYNGHPDYRDSGFDLNHDTAIIVGQGNVALDIARILVKSPDEFQSTDIAAHALEQLAESQIRNVRIVGRRGPTQARFTAKELREFQNLHNCSPIISPTDLELNDSSKLELADSSSQNLHNNLQTFRKFLHKEGGQSARNCWFDFFLEPRRILGQDHVCGVEFERTRLEGPPFRQQAFGTGEVVRIDCGIIIRSIGYRNARLPTVRRSWDADEPTNVDGRILDNGKPVPGLYVAGWAKRGSEGTIGSNRADSVATVDALLTDRNHLPPPRREISEVLPQISGTRRAIIDFADWKRIDHAEIERGKRSGKPREKFTRVTEMLNAASVTEIS